MSIVWITGRPASGKTTLGRAIVAALETHGAVATLIDSDEVRAAITPDATYAPEERLLVYRSMAYLARRLAEHHVVPVVAATAHDPALRDAVRAVAGEVVLVHARCSLSVAESRDPKGIYARARATAAGTVPGVHVPWIDPDDAAFTVDTEHGVPAAVVEEIVRSLGDLRRPAAVL